MNILAIILDYLPEEKLNKITALNIFDWYKFLRDNGAEDFKDVYVYLDAKLKLIDE